MMCITGARVEGQWHTVQGSDGPMIDYNWLRLTKSECTPSDEWQNLCPPPSKASTSQ